MGQIKWHRLRDGRWQCGSKSLWRSPRPPFTGWTIYYSYKTPIAAVSWLDGKVLINPRKYSETTSRHMVNVRADIGWSTPPIVCASAAEFRTLVFGSPTAGGGVL